MVTIDSNQHQSHGLLNFLNGKKKYFNNHKVLVNSRVIIIAN
ncbi:MAG: hypothetical protein ACXAEU_05895 [Candidatus Hodarchaeales archaeon]